jgi:signal transduction histidine kinase/ActR/RegA family two-component response regulator
VIALLSADVERRVRWCGLLLLPALVLAGCSARPPEDILTLRSAELAIEGRAPEAVQLPHSREASSSALPQAVEYRFSLPEGKSSGIGVFVTISTVPFAAYVNGMPVFQNGDASSPSIPYSSWRASPWFWVSPTALSRGPNQLVLRMFDRHDVGAVLGPVLVGPPEVVDGWARRGLLLHHFLPVLIGAILMGVGVIALALWRGRRDGTLFLLFASGTMLWGAQTLVLQMPLRIVPPPHYSVLVLGAYVWYPMLLGVFFMRFAYVRSRPFETTAAVLAASAAPLLYLGLANDRLQTVSMGLRAAVLVMIFIALGAVARFAWRQREMKSNVLLLVGALCVGLAARDYVVSLPPSDGRVTLWGIYSGAALVVLLGWLLVERYHAAYADSEASKRELEARVKAANAELVRRLEQVQAAREQAEQASVAKSRFFAAASHDLRQPLHSLGLFAAALEGHVFSRDARDIVVRIGDSINALESLFNELLDLSKLDAGAVAVHPRNFALQDLFDRLSLEFHAEAVARHLRMRFVPTSLAVRTDPVLLERVVANLVSNALRYTREGGVVIGARPRGLEVWLEVVDTGIGIPLEKQQQVFDEFFQLGNAGRDRRRGLGLGLAIVKRLSRLMGLKLTLQSESGKGTRFRLALLRAPAADVSRPLVRDPSVEPFAGRRVLLVEDDPDIRLATTNLLEQWGMTVAACTSREQVETLLDRGLAPDIALVDLRLESVDDGIDVIELARARLGHALPAMLLSGDTGAAELARVRASGVPLLTKPVSPARLKSALHAYLAGSSAATQASTAET